ncbi:MAG: rhomboid family intramembrane serine protease [Bacteroidota bacterium]|nr:rhomboid family intramembrane serine protease [Bacteroidota bacterium]
MGFFLTMDEEKKKFISSLTPPLAFVVLMWIIKLLEVIFSIDLGRFGIYPKTSQGLIGIITAPLVHADFNHLLSNSLPLLLLGTGLIYFYKSASFKIIAYIYLFTGTAVWLFARQSYHIGASGIVYGLASFLFFSGLIRRDTRSIALSLIVTFLYGGIIWGLLPLKNGISWESHLAGAVSGILASVIFRKHDPPKKYDWEDDDDYDPNEKPEISYKKGYPFDQQ